MKNTYESALLDYKLGLATYIDALHPAFMSDLLPEVVKDRASRLKRAFPGTRQHEWLHAISKAIGFSGWNNLVEESRNLRKLLLPDGTPKPESSIPFRFSKALVLVIAPGPETRPSAEFLAKLSVFTEELSTQTHHPVDALRQKIASWWGAASWEALSTRDPFLAKKSFYVFEAQPDGGRWHISGAGIQAIRELEAFLSQRRAAGEDEVPFLRQAFQGGIQEQPLFDAGVDLAWLLMQRNQNAEALKVLTTLDELTSARMPVDFCGELHCLIKENKWYLEGRYLLMQAHIANENIQAATEVCRRNVMLDSKSTWWNGSWLMMLLLTQGDVSGALRARRDFVLFISDREDDAIELPYIVVLLAHGDFSPASIRFARICQAKPRVVEYFLACIDEDKPEPPENSNEEDNAVLRYLSTSVLSKYPVVKEILVTWDIVFNGREYDATLELRRQLKGTVGRLERSNLVDEIHEAEEAEVKKWSGVLAKTAKTMMVDLKVVP